MHIALHIYFPCPNLVYMEKYENELAKDAW